MGDEPATAWSTPGSRTRPRLPVSSAPRSARLPHPHQRRTRSGGGPAPPRGHRSGTGGIGSQTERIHRGGGGLSASDGGAGASGSGGVILPKAPGARPREKAFNMFVDKPIGLDGEEINLGKHAEIASEARMTMHLANIQKHNLEEINKLAMRLRKEYDALRLLNKRKTKEMQLIQSEVTHMEKMATGKAGGGDKIGDDTDKVQKRLDDTKSKIEDTGRNKSVYNFMIERLKGQITDTDIELRELQSALERTEDEMQAAHLTLQTVKQDKIRAETLVGRLHKHLEAGRHHRQKKLVRVETTIGEERERAKQFEDRERGRQNIEHMPRGDLNEEQEDRLKQLFLVRKIYGNMLMRKLREDQKRSDKLESAFQRIRSATGLNDVDEIVDKFLNRDATFDQLQLQMQAARDRIDALRGEQVSLTAWLDKIRSEGFSGSENRSMYQRVEEYDRRLQEAKRDCEESKEKFFRISITLEESRACLCKLLQKLELDSTPLEGAIAGTAAASSRDSAARRRGVAGGGGGGGGAADSASVVSDAPQWQMGGEKGHVVTVETLEAALSQIEEKLTSHMAYLAAVFEREEANAHKSAADGSHTLARSASGAALEGDGPTQRSTMLALAEKASERVYRSMMTLKPDTSASNIRVAAKPSLEFEDEIDEGSEDEESLGGESHHSAVSGAEDVLRAGGGHKTAKELGKLLSGGGPNGTFVDRTFLKRLATMLSSEKSRKRRGGHPGRTIRRPK